MKTRLLLAGAALAVAVGLAVAWTRSEPEPQAPPPVSAPGPQLEPLPLAHRLANAEAVLIRSASGAASRRLPDAGPRLSLVGGWEAPAEPHHVRLEKVISETLWCREHEDCGGTLYAGGWIVTAAHCVSGRWLHIAAFVGQTRRDGPSSARYEIGEAAVHRWFEGCGPKRRTPAVMTWRS